LQKAEGERKRKKERRERKEEERDRGRQVAPHVRGPHIFLNDKWVPHICF
jgi:hypothetical protein